MASRQEIVALHKYFLNSSTLRKKFDDTLKEIAKCEKNPEQLEEILSKHAFDSGVLLLLWYGYVWVVIEGWQGLKLSHPMVDKLLKDRNHMALLRGLRNDVFHYQKKYAPDRTMKALQKQSMSKWVRSVHQQIGIALLEKIKS